MVLSLRETINPHPRQLEFFQAIDGHRFVLYGGARGGGKSYILRWALVRFLFQLSARGLKNVRVAIFCITYRELYRRQITKVLTEFRALGEFSPSRNEFVFHEKFGGHVIEFCNMQDLYDYVGAEYAAIAVDELTLCADRETLDILRGSLRWTGVRSCKFFAATNPTGPGHSWVKRLWITKDFSLPDDRRLDPNQFKFVRSLPRDNPHLSEEYIKEELESLSEHLRAPWLLGSWDIVAGQRFSTFRPHVHVCKPFDLTQLGPVSYLRSIDYGIAPDPYACGWYGAVKVEPEWREDDGLRLYKIQEDIANGLPARAQAKRIQDRTKPEWEVRVPSYLDTQCWAEEDEGLSIAHRYMQEGLPVQKVLKDRVTGWAALDELLAWEHEEGNPFVVTRQPVFKIFDTCPVTIQQFTDAMADPKRPGDILHPAEFRDDCLDETRYLALTHIRKPQEEKKRGWYEEGQRRASYMRR